MAKLLGMLDAALVFGLVHDMTIGLTMRGWCRTPNSTTGSWVCVVQAKMINALLMSGCRISVACCVYGSSK